MMLQQGVEPVPGQALAGEEDSLLSQQEQGDHLLAETSPSVPNGNLLAGNPCLALRSSFLTFGTSHSVPSKVCFPSETTEGPVETSKDSFAKTRFEISSVASMYL